LYAVAAVDPSAIAEPLLQDVYGPLEILNIVGIQIPDMTISIIGETKEPVPSRGDSSAGVAISYLQPTYAIDEDPELDVLRTISGHLQISRSDAWCSDSWWTRQSICVQ
jgi:hypothetical protein